MIIAAVWLLAITAASPTAVVSELYQPEESIWHQSGGHYICHEHWSDPKQQFNYTTAILLLQFCIPLLIIAFNYGCIAIEIWGKKVPGEAHQHRDLRLAQSKRKVNFHFFCFLSVFHNWFSLNVHHHDFS